MAQWSVPNSSALRPAFCHGWQWESLSVQVLVMTFTLLYSVSQSLDLVQT